MSERLATGQLVNYEQFGRCLDVTNFKPDWDPVLFSNSCYTAHLSVVDRRMALALGKAPPAVETCHLPPGPGNGRT